MNREILVANTKTQTRNKVITNATTLGELKAALDREGIDYEGMTFTEGISKTQLLNDDTQLPQNLMYKGQLTNNLVILLTNTKKKIASGAVSRADAYAIIRNRNLQEAVKSHFGRNFTQVPTSDLIAFVGESNGNSSSNSNSSSCSSNPATENHPAPATNNPCHSLSAAGIITDSFCTVVKQLYKEAVVSCTDLPFISQKITDAVNAIQKEDSAKFQKPSFSAPETVEDTVGEAIDNDSIKGISDDDIDDMIDDLNNMEETLFCNLKDM